MAIDGINRKHVEHKGNLRRDRNDDKDGFKFRYKSRIQEIEDEIEEKRSMPETSSNDFGEDATDETEEQQNRILMEWTSPEFVYFEKTKMWYLITALVFAGLVTFGIWTKSFITVITFVILFIVIYMYAQRKPEETYFAVTLDGLIHGNNFYSYDDIDAFWIDYDPPHNTAIHIQVHRLIAQKITIQLTDQDPVELRRMLIKEIPESEKLADGLAEALSRRIGF